MFNLIKYCRLTSYFDMPIIEHTFQMFQVFAFVHHAWARESKRGEASEVSSLAGFSENGSSVGGDEGYGDDQVRVEVLEKLLTLVKCYPFINNFEYMHVVENLACLCDTRPSRFQYFQSFF